MSMKRILIIDDLPLMRKLLRRFIEKLGAGRPGGPAPCQYDLLEAGNGGEGFDVLSQNRGAVDLVLLDLMMPVFDGVSFLEKRKDDPDLARVPVILTTALGEEPTVQKAMELGAVAYLRKPFTSQAFESVFCKVLGLA